MSPKHLAISALLAITAVFLYHSVQVATLNPNEPTFTQQAAATKSKGGRISPSNATSGTKCASLPGQANIKACYSFENVWTDDSTFNNTLTPYNWTGADGTGYDVGTNPEGVSGGTPTFTQVIPTNTAITTKLPTLGSPGFFARANDSASLDLTDATFSIWLKPTKVSGVSKYVILSKGTEYYLDLHEEGVTNQLRPFFMSTVNGNLSCKMRANATFPVDNAWHHLALTRTSSGTFTFYIDGVASDVTFGSYYNTTFNPAPGTCTAPLTFVSGTSPLTIAAEGSLGYRYSGMMDEVVLYNRALSAAEISTDPTSIYNTQKGYFVATVVTPGTIQFARTSSAGNTGQAFANSIAVDGAGNTVVAGYILGTVNFSIPGYSIPPISSSSVNDSDAFIAKYDRYGHPLWAKKIGSVTWLDNANGVTIDNQGNIIVTGYFLTTVDFGAKADGTHVTLTAAPIPSPGMYEQADIFVAKYDAATPPNLLWARGFGQYGPESGLAVVTDANRDIFVAGQFSTTNVDFGNPGSPIVFSTRGNNDIVLLKLTALTGATLWAKQWGGTGGEGVSKMAVDGSGNLMAMGSIPANNATDIGSGTLSAVAYTRIFVAKYSGTTGLGMAGGWPKILSNGNTGLGVGGVAIDPNTRNIIITGSMNGSMDFGGGPVLIADSTTGSAFYLASYKPDGTYNWAKAFGDGFTTTTVGGRSVAIDGNSNIAVVGVSLLMMNMGASWWTASGQGYFLTTFNSSGEFQWGRATNGGNSSTGSGVAYDPFGHIVTAGYASGSVDFGKDPTGTSIISSAPPGYTAAFVAQYSK